MNGVRCSENDVAFSAFCSEFFMFLFGGRFVRHGVFVRRWMFCSAFFFGHGLWILVCMAFCSGLMFCSGTVFCSAFCSLQRRFVRSAKFGLNIVRVQPTLFGSSPVNVHIDVDVDMDVDVLVAAKLSQNFLL